MKAHICDVRLEHRSVDIPSACPKCGANFRDRGDPQLIIGSIIALDEVAIVTSAEGDLIDYELLGEVNFGRLGKFSFTCRKCHHVITIGTWEEEEHQ